MNMAEDLSVKVAIRVRPLVNSEVAKGCKEILDVISENNQIIIRRTDKDNAFSFNYVLSSESTQEDLYTKCVQPLIGNLIKGYNVTIFAYGQTGSGKTHSMGTSYSGEGDAGIIPRAVDEIFNVARDNFMYDFTVTVSFLELYQEVLYDLLASKPRDQCVLDIREDPTKGILIPGLTEIPVNSAQEVLEILKKGSTFRMTGSTAMNSQSSRSHAIFMVNISLNHKKDCRENKQAKFNLVDLAGSERPKKTGAVGTTFKEGVNINKGLFVLGNVISCLGDEKLQHGFIPYRDSNLTRLLKDSLGGNSITLMLACVSPADYNIDETLSTLRYADRARKIKNKPVVNQDAKVAEINDLKKTIQQLRLQIVSQGGPMICPAELELLQKDIRDLKTRNKNLTMQLSNSLIENTCLHEKIMLLQTVNNTLNKKIINLKDQCDITFSKIDIGLANNDATIIQDNMEKLRQIHAEFMQVDTEQRETEQEIRFHEKAFNDHLLTAKSDNHIDDQQAVEEIDEKQETHTSRQVELNMQLTEIQKQLLLKEGLAKTLLANNQYIVDVKEMAENESKIAQLEKEKKELEEKLKSAGNGKGSELYKKRIQELENNLSFLNKKVQEQARLIKLKAKDEERIGKLNQEILQMKQAKVKLVRTMREESDKFRQWKLQKERECLKLKQQDRRKDTEIVRMKAMHSKQQTVFKRRVEHAEALNKRLKGALAMRQQVSHSKKSDQADKIEPWLKQEYELFVDLVEAEATLTELLKDRATLQQQLSELKANPESAAECKIIEDDLELRSVQIQDMQQKILDSNEETKMKNKLEKLQTMGEAKYAISFLISQAEKSHKEKILLQSKLNDIQEMCNEFQEKFKSSDLKSKALEERLKQSLVEQQKDYEEKIAILLRHRNTDNDNVVTNNEETQQMLKIQQEHIQALEKENELLKQSTEIKKPDIKIDCVSTPQPLSRIKKLKAMENIIDDSVENIDIDNILKDPDWKKTPLGKRIIQEKHTTFIKNVGQEKPVKRSFEGGCTCKTNCSSARCGCRKTKRSCGSVCKCTSCENRSEDPDHVESSMEATDELEDVSQFRSERAKKTRKLYI